MADTESAFKIIDTTENCVLITSGKIGLEIVPKLYEQREIKSYFSFLIDGEKPLIEKVKSVCIFCNDVDVNSHKKWAEKYSVIKKVTKNFEECGQTSLQMLLQ